MFMVKQGTQHFVHNVPSPVTYLSKSEAILEVDGDQQPANEKIEAKKLQLIIVNFSARCEKPTRLVLLPQMLQETEQSRICSITIKHNNQG